AARAAAGTPAPRAAGPGARADRAQVRRGRDEPRHRKGHGPQRIQRRDHPAPHPRRAEGGLGRRRQSVNDDFLSQDREEPRPEFAQALRERLRQVSPAPDPERPGTRRTAARLLPALAAAGALAALTFAFTLPPVRAAARSFLDLFRVKRFVAVPVDPDR